MKTSSKPSAPSGQLSSESTNDQPAPTRPPITMLSDVEADLLRIVRYALRSCQLHMLEGLDPQDLRGLSSKCNLFELALRYYHSHRAKAIRILLACGLSPTDLAFQQVLESYILESYILESYILESYNWDVIKLVGDALISHYSSAAENVTHGSLNANTSLACAIRDQNLKVLVTLLKQEPSRANSPTIETGNLPLASAVLWQKYTSAVMLVLLDASPVLSLAARKSPVVMAVEKADLRMANILLDISRSSLGTGWEWNVAEALVTINFNAPGFLLDSLIDKMGIPLCLRLAIEHRHERLIGYMLWQFRTRSKAYREPEAEPDEVLEQALQAGISKDYVQYIKSNRPTGLIHLAEQNQEAEGGTH
ncbi:hypothetical protein B0O99DRAFT_222725 [Bisporella sp. PMI_857]|nr:hypothetical protein B0O99DRAFT_222725 [Bisporella sp. PMI_857]